MPEPFIDGDSRPDLTVDLNAKVGDMTVRQLSDILGSNAPRKPKVVEIKQVIEKPFIKETIKEPIKEVIKDHKDTTDQKNTKDHKDTADHKVAKDHKDTVDQKATKDHKESVDGKNTKDHKDTKDHIKEGAKDHKDIIKDHKEIEKLPKEIAKEVAKEAKEFDGNPGNPGDPVFNAPQGIDQLIQRISSLEQQVATLQGGTVTEGGQG